MPQMFGSFQPDNFLLDCVCDDCNGFFGTNLEQPLGRDSTEAIYRLEHGIKKASECGDLPYRRLTITIEQDGPFHGARATIGPDAGSGVQPIPLPQVGFRRPTEMRFKWFQELELTDENLMPFKAKGWQINVIGPTDADQERLIARIQALGVPFKRQSAEQLLIHDEHNQVTVLTEATLDIPIQRAIAKIALNFVAYAFGSDFVRRSEFDSVRSFVRYASRPGYQIVMPSDQPILFYDTSSLRQTNGHVLVAEWERAGAFVVRFSPFNMITYRVLLCPSLSDSWRRMSVGYVFDYDEHKIIPLSVRPGLGG